MKVAIFKKFFQNEQNEQRTYFTLTLITGVVAGATAVLINKSVHYLTDLFHTTEPFTLKTFLIGGVLVFISGYITTRFYPSTGGSGIPGVRVALAVFHGNIKPLATLGKLVTSILSLSSGVSLGREGPTVAIAAGVGSVLGKYFSLSKKRIKALVAIGSAGGVAAAFHTPISAVVFTLEEIIGDLNGKMLGGIIISSVLASITAQVLTGESSSFAEYHYRLNDSWELIFYLIIGLSAALLGPLWVKSVLGLRKFNLKVFRGHNLSIIMISFILIGLLSWVNPAVLGGGHSAIKDILLSHLLDWRVLLSIFIFKYLATTISYASGISGGLFFPTLLMGSSLGALIGTVGQEFFPGIVIEVGPYALVGMGAFFAAVIRAPFTSIIMVFELTRDYNIVLPLMIANIVAYIISTKIYRGSIYERISEQDGIHLPTSSEDREVLESLVVEDAMVRDPVTLQSDSSIKEAFYKGRECLFSGYPVVEGNLLVGMVASNEIGKAYALGEEESTVLSISALDIISVYPDQSLMMAFHKLKKHQISRLAVVSRLNEKKLLGIITAEDIVNNFGYHIAGHDDVEKEIEKLQVFEKQHDERS